jgi:hypothetical protein
MSLCKAALRAMEVGHLFEEVGAAAATVAVAEVMAATEDMGVDINYVCVCVSF